MIQSAESKRHLLTVLVEDYFHVGAFENLILQRNWARFEPRYEQNTLKTLDLLDSFKTKATFFVLGWIGDQNPGLIREIVSRGHEVASRGFYHRSVRNLTPDEFREDLRKTSRILEDAGGQRVIGYRAAEKLTYQRDAWILDILAEEGLLYDASFLPAKKDLKSRRFAHQHHSEGRVIWEFPYSTRNVGIGLMPVSGGNYFRQIPHTIMRHAVSDWNRRYESPFVLYFHVWELDPDQPKINAASRYNRVRHYRKLDKMEWVITEYLKRYAFVSGAEFLGVESEILNEHHELCSEISPLTTTKPDAVGLKPGVTIVIPCYNEAETLPYLANTLRGLTENLRENYEPHFIFIDDCSTDGTLQKMQELFGGDECVRIIEHDANKGVAAGIMTGLKAAETELVCSLDCDCTYDPHELERMIPLLGDSVDMVTASPYHKEGRVRNVPGWRLFLSKGASFLYRRALRTKIETYTSCFRIYRRSSVVDLDLKENGFLGVAELLGKLVLRGGRIVEYPSVLEVRLFGFSKMKTFRTIFGHLKLISNLTKERVLRKNQPISTSLPNERLKAAANKVIEK